MNGTGTGTAQAGGATIPIEACLENLDTLVWVNGATTYEGGFARAHEASQTPGYFNSACFADSAIICLEHRN